MAKKKYYWKALIESGDQLTSRIVMGEYSLVYPIGKWVKPLVGKIFIFETEEDAIAFDEGYSNTCVKKCEAKGVTRPRGGRISHLQTEEFCSFWRKTFKNGSLPISNKWPLGTLWAEAIKIVE